MTLPSHAINAVLEPKDKLIVALDVSTAAEARSIIDELRGKVGAFKIGLQLFTAVGPEFVRETASGGSKVFLDLKYHDIPNTVANAAAEAARLGVWMINVHAIGGREMMSRTVDTVREICHTENIECPHLIAVTVLTSSDQDTVTDTGVRGTVGEQVLRLAGLAADSGFDGVVASPREVQAIRNITTDQFLIVTPGIRPVSATNDDQKRVTTFAQALANGSDYVVVGRPVTQAEDRAAAVREMIEELN
jgi:orotidine-5'-phosphate decarboxylase